MYCTYVHSRLHLLSWALIRHEIEGDSRFVDRLKDDLLGDLLMCQDEEEEGWNGSRGKEDWVGKERGKRRGRMNKRRD